jgi:hypothetical protein
MVIAFIIYRSRHIGAVIDSYIIALSSKRNCFYSLSVSSYHLYAFQLVQDLIFQGFWKDRLLIQVTYKLKQDLNLFHFKCF